MLTWDEIFRLQLIPAAWREVHAKVRQALMPWPNNSLLRCAASRVMPRKRMQLLTCRSHPKQLRNRWSLINPSLNPDLINREVTVRGEQRDAIRAA